MRELVRRGGGGAALSPVCSLPGSAGALAELFNELCGNFRHMIYLENV